MYFTNGSISRKECLQSGSIFDKYTLRMNNTRTGRNKMIVYDSFDGQISIHWCRHCNKQMAPREMVQIFHLKSGGKRVDEVEREDYLKLYTPKLRNYIRLIN